MTMGNAKPECNQCITHNTFNCLKVHSLKKKHEKKIDVCNVKCLCLIFIMQLRKCLFCFHLKYLYIHLSLYRFFLKFFCTAAKFICLLNICLGRIDKGLEPVSCYQCTFI